MDPNPKNFPILSYVLAKLPSFGPRHHTDASDFDIEQPPPPPSDASASAEPSFELTAQMPRLTDPKLIASMRLAVSEVAQTRSVLKTLGDRPDHESVDIAKAKLKDIESKLSNHLEEIALSDADQLEGRSYRPEKEEETKRAAKEEMRMYKAVIELDEMHDSYEKLLKDAEERLVKIYESAVAGGDAVAKGSGKDLEVEDDVVNEEVIGILEEALGKGMERIDLSGRTLRFLPEEFGRIRGLVVLNLSSNQLEVVPDSIAGLENLEELNLSSNLLESLPESIGLLVNLKILDVSGNKLNALPDSICHCRSLVELDAGFNRLTYLPTNIGYELVNLRRLSISLNKIRSLPTSIGEMSSLRLLDVHFNELHGLPHSIGRVTNLEILNLSSNFSDLTELPDTISDLTNLKELDLSNNQIHALPDTFSRLDNLTKLNLDQNPVVIPPIEVVNEGVEAVKVFMANRWLDILEEEEEKSMHEVIEQAQTGWLTRSTSWLNNVVTGVSGYLGGSPKSSVDPYLNQQL